MACEPSPAPSHFPFHLSPNGLVSSGTTTTPSFDRVSRSDLITTSPHADLLSFHCGATSRCRRQLGGHQLLRVHGWRPRAAQPRWETAGGAPPPPPPPPNPPKHSGTHRPPLPNFP